MSPWFWKHWRCWLKDYLSQSISFFWSNYFLRLLLNWSYVSSLLLIVDWWVNDEPRIFLACLLVNNNCLKRIRSILISHFFRYLMSKIVIKFEFSRVTNIISLLFILFLFDRHHNFRSLLISHISLDFHLLLTFYLFIPHMNVLLNFNLLFTRLLGDFFNFAFIKNFFNFCFLLCLPKYSHLCPIFGKDLLVWSLM